MMRLPSAAECGVACLIALVAVGAGGSIAVGQPLGFSEQHLLLESAGIDAALLDRFTSGKPLADDDRGAQVAALSAVKQVSHYYLERFAQRPKDKDWIASGR